MANTTFTFNNAVRPLIRWGGFAKRPPVFNQLYRCFPDLINYNYYTAFNGCVAVTAVVLLCLCIQLTAVCVIQMDLLRNF